MYCSCFCCAAYLFCVAPEASLLRGLKIYLGEGGCLSEGVMSIPISRNCHQVFLRHDNCILLLRCVCRVWKQKTPQPNPTRRGAHYSSKEILERGYTKVILPKTRKNHNNPHSVNSHNTYRASSDGYQQKAILPNKNSTSKILMFLIDFLLAVVGVLLSVAFFTLIERKVMGLIHYRKGPNKVLVFGVTQPIADALKLLTKENPKLSPIKTRIYTTGPRLALTLIILYWAWYDFSFNCRSRPLKIIVVFAVIRLTSYRFITIRWGSNTKYSLIGGHRVVAQIISYEVCLILFALRVVYLSKRYSLERITKLQQGLWILWTTLPLCVTWFMLCLAETNRTPFDLAEGESEIVSGFNIEYGGGLFALIFIREYGIIIFLRCISCYLFLRTQMTLMKTLALCSLFVWARRCFPRVRYDTLIIIRWKIALPFRLATLCAARCLM